MTKEELQQAIRKNQEIIQNQFINKILDDVQFLCEKANRKDYEPTEYERTKLYEIYIIVNNMMKWF